MKKLSMGLIASLMLIAFVAGCSKKEPPAVVNGDVISEKKLDRHVKLRLREHKMQGYNVETHYLKAAVLEQLIAARLMIQGAKEMGVAVSDDELNAEVERLKGNQSAEDFNKSLKENDLTMEEFKEGLRDTLLVKKFLVALYPDNLLTEEEMINFYKNSPTPFLKPAEVHVRFIQADTEEQARAVMEDLNKAGDFDKTADKIQAGGKGVVSGYGWTSPEMFNPDMAAAMKSVEVGKFKGPIRGTKGFYIIRVDDKKPEGIKSYEEAKGEIKEALLSTRRENASGVWVDERKNRSKIIIHE